MSLFRAELYKILRRRVLWGILAVTVVVVYFWFWAALVTDADAVVDGVRYTGMEAIAKNREIARQWEGTLTVEKLFEMVDTYGLAVNEGAEAHTPRGGNWVSRYATDQLTDYLYRDNHTTVSFKGGEELSNLEQRLEMSRPYFCYMENVDFLYEMCFSVNFLVLLIVILAVTPVFTEEYQCGTAAVLLTGARGGKETVIAKVAAAIFFAEGLYVLADVILWSVFLLIYGTDGLFAGAGLVTWVVMGKYVNCAVWQPFLINFLWGMLGVLLMVVMTMLFSAAWRQGFLVFGASLAFLIGGYALPNILTSILPRQFMRALCLIFECNPFYLMSSVSRGSYIGEAGRLFLILVWIAAGAFIVQRKWKRCEG